MITDTKYDVFTQSLAHAFLNGIKAQADYVVKDDGYFALHNGNDSVTRRACRAIWNNRPAKNGDLNVANATDEIRSARRAHAAVASNAVTSCPSTIFPQGKTK